MMIKKAFTIIYVTFSDLRLYFSMLRWRLLLKHCGNKVFILSGTKIIGPNNVNLGDNTWIGHNSFIMAGADVIIGDWCQIANNTIITTTNHLINGSYYFGNVETKEIVIGNNVWIGSNSIILPGVTIGDNSVIAAGAVVNKAVPKNKIYGGVPAKELKDLKLNFIYK